MVEIQQIQNQLRQQRQSLEEARRRALSQQNIRQTSLLQRQQQARRLTQQEQQITSAEQEIQEQLRQQQLSEAIAGKQGQKQEALRILVEKGKGSSELYSLTPQERAEVEAIASDIKRRQEQDIGRQISSFVKTETGQELTPQLQKQLLRQYLATGRIEVSVPQNQMVNLGGSPTNNLSPIQGPIPRAQAGFLYDEPSFRQTGQLKQVKQELFQGPVPRFTNPQYFAETGKKVQLPLVVTKATGTFQDRLSSLSTDIKTAYQKKDLPQVVRSVIGTGSGLFITEAGRRTAEALQKRGVATEGPLAREVSFPTERVIGDIVLGSVFAPAFSTATAGQVVVSRYVKNGIVYEVDNLGNVVSARPVSQINKEITDFRQALRESAVFKKAGGNYYNEANLREKTRELVNRANSKQLESLRKLYRQEGRIDLFNDILAQERDIIKTTRVKTQQALKDKPVQIVGAGQTTSLSSQFAGTGLYERTEAVSVVTPKTTQANPQALMSNIDLALGQSTFNRERLATSNLLGLRQFTAQISKSNQLNMLGLKQPQSLAQPPIQIPVSRMAQSPAQAQRSQQRQILIKALSIRFGKPQRSVRVPPKPIGFPLPNLPEGAMEKISKKQMENLLIGIEVKRFGKFQKIGEETTLERALKKGAKITDVTLARSFRLRELGTGELLDVSRLPVGFRRAKRLPKTFVEESRFALSTGGEKGEIKYFKNIKSKKGRRLI